MDLLETRELLSAANLVVNGGFESGDFAPGWTLDGNTDCNFVDGIANPPHSGNFAAQLGSIEGFGYPDTPVTLTQVVPTVAGKVYVFSFWEAVTTQPDLTEGIEGADQFNNSFSASLNGVPVLSLSREADHGYNRFSFVFSATGPTAIQFEAHNNPNFTALDDVSVTEPAQITYLSTNTFITTDSITLQASIASAMAGAQVTWTVQGQGAASGVEGFPTDYLTTTDETGTATFTFTPSDNPELVNNRRTLWTGGSRDANPAIIFEVTATCLLDSVEYTASLSDTNLGPLTQDETDRLRQEYYDYSIPVPGRDEVVPSLGAGYNEGNYSVQLSVNLPGHYDVILAAYHGRQVTVMIDGQDYDTSIPDDAPITISSGYRNPQRNRAIGSQHADSRHTRGRALDLVPGEVQVQVMVNGILRTVPLPLHETLYPALLNAAVETGVTAIAEQGPTQVTVGDPGENHIHVQW